MSGKQISLIYFYIISAASLALIVIGIFNTVNFIINSTQYDKYPLKYMGVGCESYPHKYAIAPYPERLDQSTPSAQELEEQKKRCLEQEEYDRKQHRVEDLRNAITFTTVGIVLFLIHFPLARKHTKD